MRRLITRTNDLCHMSSHAAETRRLTNAALMLLHCPRRWDSNILLYQHLVNIPCDLGWAARGLIYIALLFWVITHGSQTDTTVILCVKTSSLLVLQG